MPVKNHKTSVQLKSANSISLLINIEKETGKPTRFCMVFTFDLMCFGLMTILKDHSNTEWMNISTLLLHCDRLVKDKIWTFSNYQLNAQFLYSSTICMLHYDPQHLQEDKIVLLQHLVSSPSVNSRTVCRWRADSVRSQPANWYNLPSWGWAACCSKHVDDHSVTYILLKNKGIVH